MSTLNTHLQYCDCDSCRGERNALQYERNHPNEEKVYVDSNGNRIHVRETGVVVDNCPILCCVLEDDPDKGYLVQQLPEGSFGDNDCPSSYNMPCLTWFGEGETYPDANAAMKDISRYLV